MEDTILLRSNHPTKYAIYCPIFYLLGLKKSFFRLTWLPSFSSQYTKNWKWHHKKNHGRKDLCFHRFPMNIVSKTALRRVASSKFLRLIFKIASNLHFYITPKTKKWQYIRTRPFGSKCTFKSSRQALFFIAGAFLVL